MKYYCKENSPLGIITLTSDGLNLTGLWLEGQKGQIGNAILKDDLEIFNETKKWLSAYFNQEEPSIDSIKISFNGSPFRKRVWELLCKIPYGSITTYGAIASILAKEKGIPRMSAQAVGNAVGSNPIAIIVPCHRVIGANQSLTGYAGGIHYKEALLKLEGHKIEKNVLKKS
ncbi:MAG: methylated-DNA--[protein]-cysteine S-methyltransferase [Anaeroplasmataceae bacterium]|nr:methylated-DNA--[protein]-cysteine S-methyltransferase [Anaeroplasmataceae bacterium]